MPDPTTAELVKLEAGLPNLPVNDVKLLAAVKAANAYVRRYHDDPLDALGQPAEWRDDYRLGAAKLGAGLYRNANAPGISDNGLGMSSDQAYRRATDVLIEQLLQIGRHSLPGIG